MNVVSGAPGKTPPAANEDEDDDEEMTFGKVEVDMKTKGGKRVKKVSKIRKEFKKGNAGKSQSP